MLLVVSLAACDDDSTTVTPDTPSPSENDATVVPVTPAEKPEDVPEAAEAVTESESLGQISREAGQTPEGVRTRVIQSLTCSDGVMTIGTDEETVYGAIACDSVPSGEQLDLFLEKEAAILLEVVDERSRILIETVDGSQAEFTVAGIWVR